MQIGSEYPDSVAITRIVTSINSNFENIDLVQLNKDLTNLGINRTFNTFNSTYDELKATGGITLITDVQLKKSINAYYQKLNRYQQILNNNSMVVNRFRLEDFYRKGFMAVEYEELSGVVETNDIMSLINDLDNKDELRQVALSNIQKKENLLLLVNGLSARKAIYKVALNTLKEIETSTKDLIGQINKKLKE